MAEHFGLIHIHDGWTEHDGNPEFDPTHVAVPIDEYRDLIAARDERERRPAAGAIYLRSGSHVCGYAHFGPHAPLGATHVAYPLDSPDDRGR